MFSDGLHWGLHWATPGRRAEALLQGLFSYKYLCEAKPKKLYWDLEKQKLLLLVYRSPPLGHLKSGVQWRVQKPPFQLDPRISSACMQGLYLQRQDRRGTVFSFLMGLSAVWKAGDARSCFCGVQHGVIFLGRTFYGAYQMGKPGILRDSREICASIREN